MLKETIKPDPDSQYRLLPCKCGGEPVYQHWFGAAGDYWKVECPKCGRHICAGTIRHELQIEWNTANKA